MSTEGLAGLVPALLRAGPPHLELLCQLSTAVDDPAEARADIRLDPVYAEAFCAPEALAALERRLQAVWAQASPDLPVARAQALYEVLAARQGVQGVRLKVGRPGCWLVMQTG